MPRSSTFSSSSGAPPRPALDSSRRAFFSRIDWPLVGVVAFVLAAEAGLRLQAAAWPSLGWRGGPPARETGYLPPPHIFDPDRGYRYRGRHRGRFVRADFDNVMVTNAHGFRGPEFSLEKPAGAYRLALLGDSMLAANGVQIEQTWAYLLGTRLERLGDRRVEVLNLGVDGYRGWHITRLVETRLLDFGPDAVVLWADHGSLRNPYEEYRAAAGNTILASYDPDVLLARSREQAGQVVSVGRALLSTSYLARSLTVWLGKRPQLAPEYWMLPSTPLRTHRFDDLMGRVVTTLRRHEVPLAVFYRNRRPPDEEDPWRRWNVPVFTDGDVFPTYAGLTWPSDPHFSIEGHAVYARGVLPIFERLLDRLERGEPGRSAMKGPPFEGGHK